MVERTEYKADDIIEKIGSNVEEVHYPNITNVTV